jgi:hypothetical protein
MVVSCFTSFGTFFRQSHGRRVSRYSVERQEGLSERRKYFSNPRRLRDDYVPTGFVGYGIKTRAVGLDLSMEDKKALIGFLKTL